MMPRELGIIGCGQLGLQLAEKLAGRPGVEPPPRIVATTTSPARVERLAAAGTRPVVLRLAEEQRLHETIASCDTVVLTVAPRGGASHRETYLEGVGHLMRACAGTRVRHVIYTSATSVYGQEDGTWVDERSPTEPRSENGRMLLAAEQALLAAAGGLDITASVLRLAGIYGPARGPLRAVARFAGRRRDDGDAYLNLVHEEDVVRALLLLLERPLAGILNLNDDRPTPRREYYDRLFAEQGLPPIQWVTARVARLGKRVRNDAIKRALGLALLHPEH